MVEAEPLRDKEQDFFMFLKNDVEKATRWFLKYWGDIKQLIQEEPEYYEKYKQSLARPIRPDFLDVWEDRIKNPKKVFTPHEIRLMRWGEIGYNRWLFEQAFLDVCGENEEKKG